MAMLTLAKAADESGLSKSMISKAIRSGRLHAEKTASGAYQIDSSDLEAFAAAPEERRRHNDEHVAEERIIALEAENRSLKKQISLLKQQVADVQLDRDRWASQAASAQHMARSGERALRRTSKGLAELRQEALIEAREAARSMAEQAARIAAGEETWPKSGEQPEETATGFVMRFGRRSSDVA